MNSVIFRTLWWVGCVTFFAGITLKQNEETKQGSGNEHQKSETKADAKSVTYCLELKDWQKFRVGRSKRDILDDINWCGTLQESTKLDGKLTTSICYGINGGYLAESGTVVLAIFEDDKFVKFIEPPKGDNFPEKLGSFGYLRRCRNAPSVDARKLDEEYRKKIVKRSFDPGLTIAFLPFAPTFAAKQAVARNKNALLRDQFNACRINLGMSQEEVEKLFRAKPLYTGNAESVAFAVFGVRESLDLADKQLHVSNVIVTFQEGKASGICCVEVGAFALRTLKLHFNNLPDSFAKTFDSEKDKPNLNRPRK